MAEATPETPVPVEEAPQGTPADLGDAGKQALDRMKSERNAARTELQKLQTRIREFEDRDKTELQRASDRAAEAEKRLQELEASQKTRDREFKVRRSMLGKVVDDEVALPLVLKKLGDDEDPTDRRIEKAIEEVLAEKTYLAPQQSRPDWGSGPRNGSGKTDLNDWFRNELTRNR